MGEKKQMAALKPSASIFGDEIEQEIRENEVFRAPLDILHEMKNHPFRVRDDKSMMDLAQSIEMYGVLSPGLVCKREGGGYELIAGNRRRRASFLAGKPDMPVILLNVDADTAIQIMVQSNCQREDILPSEKANAYKMMMEAMKRQGKRTDLTSSQAGTKFRADADLAQKVNESRNQVQRYIRLAELITDLLQMVDDNKLPMNTGVELSYLQPQKQEIVLSVINGGAPKPTTAQARLLKKMSQEEGLTHKAVIATLVQKPFSEVREVRFREKELSRFFPADYSAQQMTEVIVSLLSEWSQKADIA